MPHLRSAERAPKLDGIHLRARVECLRTQPAGPRPTPLVACRVDGGLTSREFS